MKTEGNCIIFDCDGTLVDSEFLCHFAMELKLKELGVSEPAQSMMHEFRGAKLAAILHALNEKHDLSLDDDFVISYRTLVAHLFKTELKAVEGVKKVLDKVQQTVCVASSGPMEKIQLALSVTGLHHYFASNIFSSYDIDSWKPEPDLFLHAAKRMNCNPLTCIVVEDSPIGIEAALAANMQAIYYNPAGESLSGATTITKMKELLDVIL